MALRGSPAPRLVTDRRLQSGVDALDGPLPSARWMAAHLTVEQDHALARTRGSQLRARGVTASDLSFTDRADLPEAVRRALAAGVDMELGRFPAFRRLSGVTAGRIAPLSPRKCAGVGSQSRAAGVSGRLGFVHLLLTKRRAVDFCRLHSSLCQMS